jgi:SWI/SNF-related matrix-associated actin-dependent regulator 1 of chromatin subfamily A
MKHIIALSGTAILNRPIELFNTLNILNPRLFPNKWNFAHKYCGAKHTGFGWDFNGASNMDELHSILRNHLMIRRKKQDVLKELPDKTYNYIPIEISNRKDYDYAKDEFIAFVTQNISDELNEAEISLQKELGYVNIALNKEEIIQEKVSSISKAETLVKIGHLQQMATEGIISQVKEWIYNFLENDEKLVLFATHRRFITEIENEFKDISVKIDGSTPVAQRQRMVDDFQNNKKIRLFIGNIKAAGVGITLTASSNVAFIEYPWSPGDLTQAMDRCHRIGQKKSKK